MKHPILAVTALALFAGSALAATDPRANTPSTMSPGSSSATAPVDSTASSGQFAKLDTDGDGIVSKKEAAKNNDVKKQWSKLDTNKDGKLDTMEFSQFELAAPAGKY